MSVMKAMLVGATASSLVLSAMPASAQPETPSLEEMWKIIQAQQTTITELKKALKKTTSQNVQTQEAVEETQQSVEETRQSVEAVAVALETGSSDLNTGWWDKTSIGGYGEMHYQGGPKDQLDFHRFVLFFGHEFTDKIRFFSEMELEHSIAGDGKVGEIELEQGYIEADIGDNTQIYGGMNLIPVGILNENHEPTTFYGVERNIIEKDIIPTTWFEGGIGVHGTIGQSGFAYDAVLSSGLELNALNGFKVRSGRQNVAEANFKDQAYSGRLSYSGIPGIKLAGSLYYQNDVTQGIGDAITGKTVSAFLWSTNVDAQWKRFGLRALYADWSLDGAEVDLSGRNKQAGYYIEPSYKFELPLGAFEDARFGVFYRYANWDNNQGLSTRTGRKRHVFGTNFWPVPGVVMKMDYIIENRQNEVKSRNSLNLGIGYQF